MEGRQGKREGGLYTAAGGPGGPEGKPGGYKEGPYIPGGWAG